jgi:D-inositol-3-phosphate glycosyltransferase
VAPAAEGRIDHPGEGTTAQRGAFTVSGWAIFPAAATSRVEVRLEGQPLGLAQLGVARPDLEGRSDSDDAIIAGFTLAADLTEWTGADGPVALGAEAVSVDGERFTLPPVELTLTPAPVPPAAPAPRRTAAARPGGRRLLVCTHQLCLGGASRYLLETLEALIRAGAASPVVLSPIGGPLRPYLEELGIPVHVSGQMPIDDPEALDGRVEEIAAWAGTHEVELAFVNTASPLTLCGAEAARALGIPAVWAIHESFEPPVLWGNLVPEVRRRMEEALGEAALAVFEADATRQIYEPLLPGRCQTVPYGLDLRAIDELRAGFDRDETRRRLSVPPEAELIVCVGVIEPRKAQAALAQAFDLIAERHPDARLALIGSEGTADSEALARWVESSRLADRIELVPTTPEIQQWYGVADLLVCASRVESLPRAVLEAMAWELPVLSTAIFGLPELIDDGETGWLCEPGDTRALADALERVLDTDPAERRRVGAAARRLVETRHDLDTYAARVARLFDQVVAGARAGRPGNRASAEPTGRPGSPPG